MSSSATIVNGCERGDCVQQPSTGRHHGGWRRSLVNASSPTDDGEPGVGDTRLRWQRSTTPTAAVEPGTGAGNTRRRRPRRTPPTADGEPGTSLPTTDGEPGVGDTRPRRQRRTPPTAASTTPTAAVEPGTGAGNTRRRRPRRTPPTADGEPGTSPTADGEPGVGDTRPRRPRRTPPTAAGEPGTSLPTADGEPGVGDTRPRRQRRTPPTAAVEPGTGAGNNRRRRPRRTAPTADGDPGTDEDNTRLTGPRRTRAIENDLTPAERAIPDTTLLHDLGNHLSAYARAGRGPPTQNLNCRGAWRTAIELYHEANDQYKDLFIDAGFEDFLKIEPVDLPVAYNVALMERWFSETNTLHLPCCEIGPTPVDWTMVTGLRFGGQRIRVNDEYTLERALELLGAGRRAKKDGKILLSNIKPTTKEVEDAPATDEVKEKVFRRLFLYVVGSCFFNNNRSVISHKLVKCLERINEVGSYDWGAITYSAFLAGMRRKATAEIGALTAFWQFLPLWAFEYLDINRPKRTEVDVFPRALRWICPKKNSDNDSQQFFGPLFISSRCQLDYVEESQVTWQPYLATAKYSSHAMESTIDLGKKRVQFQSIDTWEYYLGERCLRQLGFPCRVPNDPPEKMHGTTKDGPENEIGPGISAESLVDERLEYASWFATNSIGRILNVNRFLGGLAIAEKVIDQWMAKHQPDLMLIHESEYEKMKEDREAAEVECAKLREELCQARGEESCHV